MNLWASLYLCMLQYISPSCTESATILLLVYSRVVTLVLLPPLMAWKELLDILLLLFLQPANESVRLLKFLLKRTCTVTIATGKGIGHWLAECKASHKLSQFQKWIRENVSGSHPWLNSQWCRKCSVATELTLTTTSTMCVCVCWRGGQSSAGMEEFLT